MNIDFKILILDDSFNLAKLNNHSLENFRAIICLFWLAPSTKFALRGLKDIPIFSLQEIIASEMEWGRQAFEIARQVFTQGPLYAGLPLRNYLAEPLCNASFSPPLMTKVIEIVKQLQVIWGNGRVRLEGYLPKLHIDLFSEHVSADPSLIFDRTSLNQDQIPISKSNLINSLLNKLQEGWGTKDWRTPFMDLLEWLDKTYRYRCLLGPKLKRSSLSKGGITFFSSYQNNSRILSNFVDLMPLPVTWLLTNYSAFKGIGRGRHKVHWVWQFLKDIGIQPGDDDAADLGTTEDQSLALDFLRSTEAWKDWQKVECLLLVNLTRSWEAYLDEAEPRLVVMANQWGVEGWFTQLARRRGIPVLQVMHGVLGGYLYTQTPILSDAMVAPGEFWKNLWPEDQRYKIFVFNPPGYFAKISRPLNRSPQNLTFFSWPLAMVPYYNFYEITDGFIRIFHNLLVNNDMKITVRAHPLENPQDFTSRWHELYGPLPARLKIVKEEPLEVTLKNTDLALMYRSTVMLNCLANDIPVVMPGWIDYGWNDGLVDLSKVYMAQDFQDLEEKLLSLMSLESYSSAKDLQEFVRFPGAGKETFLAFIYKMMTS